MRLKGKESKVVEETLQENIQSTVRCIKNKVHQNNHLKQLHQGLIVVGEGWQEGTVSTEGKVVTMDKLNCSNYIGGSLNHYKANENILFSIEFSPWVQDQAPPAAGKVGEGCIWFASRRSPSAPSSSSLHLA